MHFSAFRISNSKECLIVKDWSKIMNDRREALGVIRADAQPTVNWEKKIAIRHWRVSYENHP